jgi:hypothetical protein
MGLGSGKRSHRKGLGAFCAGQWRVRFFYLLLVRSWHVYQVLGACLTTWPSTLLDLGQFLATGLQICRQAAQPLQMSRKGLWLATFAYYFPICHMRASSLCMTRSVRAHCRQHCSSGVLLALQRRCMGCHGASFPLANPLSTGLLGRLVSNTDLVDSALRYDLNHGMV